MSDQPETDQLAVGMIETAYELAEELIDLPHDDDPITLKTILYRFAGSPRQYSINARTEAPGVYLAMLLARTEQEPVAFRIISVKAYDSFAEKAQSDSAPTAIEEAIEV